MSLLGEFFQRYLSVQHIAQLVTHGKTLKIAKSCGGLSGAIFWGRFSLCINTFAAKGFSETRPFMHLSKQVFRSQ